MEHIRGDEMSMANLAERQRTANRLRLRLGERRLLLVLGDAMIALLALAGSLVVWGSRLRFIEFDLNFLVQRVPGWFYFLPLIWLLLLIENYDIHRAISWRRTVRGVGTAVVIGFALYLAVYFAYADAPNNLPRIGVAVFLALVAGLTLAWRRLFINLNALPALRRRVLVVGGGRAGTELIKVIDTLKPPPFQIMGIIDDDPDKQGTFIGEYRVLGTSGDLQTVVVEKNVSDVLVAISGVMHSHMFQALLDVQEFGVEISRMPRLYEDILGRVPIRLLEADWILRSFVDEMRVSGFYSIIKRVVDIAGALVGLILLGALLPFIALAITLDDGWPIFYAQTRSGRNSRNYQIVKLRTMRRDAEVNGRPQWASERDVRATRVGRFLRMSHLDELPQFWNVLRGEMSLVGPRAERPELVELFQQHVPFYRARLLVKPGITGWAQVNFGYATSIEETTVKLEYDLFYIKNRNLWLDLVILLRTPATMLGFRGR